MTQEPRLPIPFKDLAHVIRTPLTVIKTQVSLSQAKAKSNKELKELAQTVNEQVELLTTILDDITLISNSGAGLLKPGNENVSVSEIASEVIEKLKTKSESAKVDLNLVIEAEQTVTADKEHIRRLVARLISASLLDGATKVNLVIGDDFIAIEDNGLGTSIDQSVLNSKTPKYSRRSSVGIVAIKTIGMLYGFRLEISAGPSGSKIELRRL